MLIDVTCGLMSAFVLYYCVYKHINENCNVNLSFILYIVGFIVLRTLFKGVMCYQLSNDESSQILTSYWNMVYDIIPILSILAIIFVVGMVAYLDIRIVYVCLPYVIMECAILFEYFTRCNRCCN